MVRILYMFCVFNSVNSSVIAKVASALHAYKNIMNSIYEYIEFIELSQLD
jgi:hypothetical protein